MWYQLKQLIPSATFFYGPLTRIEAMEIPVQSWATMIGAEWYAGTTDDVIELKDKKIVP